jgi:hypothetical protein
LTLTGTMLKQTVPMFTTSITPRNITLALAQVAFIFAIIILFTSRIQDVFANM